MRVVHRLVAFIIVALVAGVGWYALHEKPIDRVFGGSTNAAIVAQPSRLEAYRLGPLPEQSYGQDVTPADYPVIAGPVILPTAIAAEVSKALLSPGTYGWNYAKACIPAYGIQLTFLRNADRIDVLFCFECDVLCVSRDGREVGGEDFDNSRAVFVHAAKAAFPDDVVIQQLQEVRP